MAAKRVRHDVHGRPGLAHAGRQMKNSPTFIPNQQGFQSPNGASLMIEQTVLGRSCCRRRHRRRYDPFFRQAEEITQRLNLRLGPIACVVRSNATPDPRFQLGALLSGYKAQDEFTPLASTEHHVKADNRLSHTSEIVASNGPTKDSVQNRQHGRIQKSPNVRIRRCIEKLCERKPRGAKHHSP